MSDRPPRVEACVDSLEAAQAARRAGADRIELCAALDVDGLTPDPGLVAACVEHAGLPVHVMVRPRAGDFVGSPAGLGVMAREIRTARELGAAGVVFGVLDRAGRVDVEAMRPLVAAARPLAVTFHRAFDVTRDLHEALEALLALGIDRVLTSGGAATAAEGAAALADLVGRARDRLIVMAGGGVRANNVSRLIARSGVREVHARCDPEAMAGLVRAVAEAAPPGSRPRPPGSPADQSATGTRPAALN